MALEFAPGPLDRNARFYVAGHRGLVGSAIWRKLEAEGFSGLVGRTSSELDLTDRDAVFAQIRRSVDESVADFHHRLVSIHPFRFFVSQRLWSSLGTFKPEILR